MKSEPLLHHPPAPPGTALSPSFWLGLLALLVMACALVNIGRSLPVFTLSLLAFVALAVSRTPLRRLLRLVPLASFGFFCMLLLLIVPIEPDTPTVVLPLWGRPIPEQGAWFVAALMVKSTLIVLLVTAFAERLSERDLLVGLTGLRLPPKLVSLCYLMVRGVRSIGGEVMRLLRARDARGRPRGLRAVRVAAAMAQVLIIRLGLRAETQAFALCARGYAGRLVIADFRCLSALEFSALTLSAVVLIWMITVWP